MLAALLSFLKTGAHPTQKELIFLMQNKVYLLILYTRTDTRRERKTKLMNNLQTILLRNWHLLNCQNQTDMYVTVKSFRPTMKGTKRVRYFLVILVKGWPQTFRWLEMVLAWGPNACGSIHFLSLNLHCHFTSFWYIDWINVF